MKENILESLLFILIVMAIVFVTLSADQTYYDENGNVYDLHIGQDDSSYIYDYQAGEYHYIYKELEPYDTGSTEDSKYQQYLRELDE